MNNDLQVSCFQHLTFTRLPGYINELKDFNEGKEFFKCLENVYCESSLEGRLLSITSYELGSKIMRRGFCKWRMCHLTHSNQDRYEFDITADVILSTITLFSRKVIEAKRFSRISPILHFSRIPEKDGEGYHRVKIISWFDVGDISGGGDVKNEAQQLLDQKLARAKLEWDKRDDLPYMLIFDGVEEVKCPIIQIRQLG